MHAQKKIKGRDFSCLVVVARATIAFLAFAILTIESFVILSSTVVHTSVTEQCDTK